MKKILKVGFVCFLVAVTTLAIWQYYETLPIRGSYETGEIHYPQINSTSLKKLLSDCSIEELEKMQQAGLEALKWQHLLKKVQSNVIADVIKNFDDFFIRDRYPRDQSNDHESQSSYFYHSHRAHEHGHFHVYFSNEEMLQKLTPLSLWDEISPNTHLVAISMHPDGNPIGLFLPNQWVTADDWYHTEDMLSLLDHFEIAHPYPSWPSNQWINQMIKLFKPQLKHLYQRREQFIQESNQPLETLLENKKIDEITSIAISIADQMDMIDMLLQEKLAEQANEQLIK